MTTTPGTPDALARRHRRTAQARETDQIFSTDTLAWARRTGSTA